MESIDKKYFDIDLNMYLSLKICLILRCVCVYICVYIYIYMCIWLIGSVLDREAWRAAIHRFAKSRTRLSD